MGGAILKRSRASIGLALAALLLAAGGAQVGGETQSEFAGGLPEQLLVFPPGGGENSSAAVELPAGVEVLSAAMDIEGRRGLNGSSCYLTDFMNSSRNLAWAGEAAVLPPVLPPPSYEDLNITAEQGIKKSDDVRYQTLATSAAPYHLFEFFVGDVNVSDFNLTWEGIGFTHPQIGFGDNGATLYLWDHVSRVWVAMDTQGVPEVPVEVTLRASVATSPLRYIGLDGYICAFVAPKRIQYDNELSTDYVMLTYGGYYSAYPENLTLDVGGDGSVEWQRPGPLSGTESFSGPSFVSALQRAVDAASGETALVPLRFSSTSGGLLRLSNLSIGYGPKDLPPELRRSIPAQTLPEDGSSTEALDLREYFSDDGGAANLTYELIWEDATDRVRAVIEGGLLSFSAAVPDWSGEIHAHVCATDAKGQGAVSNSFAVRVTPVNDPPVLDPVGELRAIEREPFEHDFSATDVDGDQLRFSLNSSLMSIDPSSGRASLTPTGSDVGAHALMVTVEDPAGARDSLNFTLVVENVNDPPSLVGLEDMTVSEGQELRLQLQATDPDLSLGLDSLRFSDDSPLVATSPEGLVFLVPDDPQVGVHRVNFTVTDSGGLTDTRGITLTVLNVNDAPAVENPGDLTALEDAPFHLRVNASDEDAGDSLRFSSATSLFVITQSGEASFTPTQRDVGTHRVRVTVTDKAGATGSVEFNITVINVNDLPASVRILGPLEGQSFLEGREVVLEASAEDEDGDELSYVWRLDGERIGEGRVLRTSYLKAGRHTILVEVSDGTETVSSEPVTITVRKPSKPSGFIPGPGAGAALAALLLLGLGPGRGPRSATRPPSSAPCTRRSGRSPGRLF
ncbi:MAG: tandem-95 repeat protein [Thermoplasmatota archaeon]